MIDDNFRNMVLIFLPLGMIFVPIIGGAIFDWIGRELSKFDPLIAEMDAQEAAKKASQNNETQAA